MSSNADFWQGATSEVPVVNTNGNIFEEAQVATAGQTVFTLATFIYTPNTKTIFVYRKTAADGGVGAELLRRGVDYFETDSVTVTLAAGATVGDALIFLAYAIQQIIPPIVFNGMPAGGTAGQVLTKASGSDYDAMWANASSITTLLDAPRQNIASASTVNLTTLAATTRNIQITGTVQIDGFQVANGEVWVAKFASSLILKNNGNTITESGQDIKVSPNDTCLIRAIADNVVEIIAYSRADSSLPRNFNDFRLSLTTGVPVTIADVIAATTLYCVPYKGDKISLFSGTSWVVRESAQFSIPLAGLTANLPYDVFCYDNAGTPTLELLVWTSTTARATALTTQDGVYVKSGDATRKYLGTFQALSATTTTDSKRQRLIWNYYNRVTRSMGTIDATANWNYTIAAYRQANGNAANQLEYVCGVQEDGVSVTAVGQSSNTSTGVNNFTGIGVNSTTVNSAQTTGLWNNPAVSISGGAMAKYDDYTQLGFTKYVWLENSVATGTTTWRGAGIAGLSGTVMG